MEGFLLLSLGCSHVKGALTLSQSGQVLFPFMPTQLTQPPGPRDSPLG